MDENRPKIGIALSGASGKAIAHIAVLEVLMENNIPVDVIVGCSSGALIAASFAAGTLDKLKQWFYNASLTKVLKLWSMKNAKGALFHINNKEMDRQLTEITGGLRFEDITHCRLGFVAADLNTAELVVLNMGNINKAFKASVAVPGLFEPVVWGRKILVDGGLVNVVPTLAVKQMGADIVIGVNIAATRFIYKQRLPIWRGYRFLSRIMGLPKLLFRIDSQSDVLEEEDIKVPGFLTVLSKAIEHSFHIQERWKESDEACDLMLKPSVKNYGRTEFKSMKKIYLEGRRTAQAAIPKIRKLIENYKLPQQGNEKNTLAPKVYEH